MYGRNYLDLKPVTMGPWHRLSDNGVGDYNFVCDVEHQRKFVPVMLAGWVTASPCAFCGQRLTEDPSGSPNAPATQEKGA